MPSPPTKAISTISSLRGRLFGSAIQVIYGLIAILGFLSWLRNRKQTSAALDVRLGFRSFDISAFLGSLRLPITAGSPTASPSRFSPLQTSRSGICCCICWSSIAILFYPDGPAFWRASPFSAEPRDGVLILLDWSGLT